MPGCVLTACGSMKQHIDLAYHMGQSTKTTHAKCRTKQLPYMRGWNISMLACQQWFVLEVVARTMYKKQLYALDVLLRKLCRSIVTPAGPWNGMKFSITETIGPEPSHEQLE